MTLFGIDIKQHLLSSHKQKPHGMCGIQITEKGVACAHVSSVNQKLHLECYEFYPCDPKPDKITTALSLFVKNYQLFGVPCTWVLRPKDYLLIPVGILPVKADEIQQALQFYVKDRIDIGLSKALITHFTLPPIQKNSTDEFIYAVVAQKDYVENMAQFIRQSGLDLINVDINELALKNVVSISAQYENLSNVGLIEMNESQTALMFIQSNIIHLIRQIDQDKNLPMAENIQKISAEIQRSLDYYENELGQAPINRFYVPPIYGEAFSILKSALPFDLQELTLEPLLSASLAPIKNSSLCISAIGGALRYEDNYVPATS